MGNKIHKHPTLRVIQGGLCSTVTFARLKITATPELNQPYPIDAIVLEEDTWLVMSAEPKYSPKDEHPIRFMTDLIESKPENIGSVLVTGDNPVRLLAVVHDVNREPTWKEEWIEKALNEIFKICERYKFKSLGLNLLGTKHGRLEDMRFVYLLGKVLKQNLLLNLRKLWLIAPIKTNYEIIRELKLHLGNDSS